MWICLKSKITAWLFGEGKTSHSVAKIVSVFILCLSANEAQQWRAAMMHSTQERHNQRVRGNALGAGVSSLFLNHNILRNIEISGVIRSEGERIARGHKERAGKCCTKHSSWFCCHLQFDT
jgi:hypothetical protein